jgi:hypothetical protein
MLGRWDSQFMQRHPSSAYLSSQKVGRHRPITLPRRGLFRTAQLNAAGWSAVVGLCAAGAGAGLVAARFTRAATWITMPAGGAFAMAGLIAADRRKWAAMPSTYAWTDNLDDVLQIADMLTRAGIAVSVEIDEFDQPMLRFLNRDRRRIRGVFRSAGLSFPPTL